MVPIRREARPLSRLLPVLRLLLNRTSAWLSSITRFPYFLGSWATRSLLVQVAAVLYNNYDINQNAGGITVDTWAAPTGAAQLFYTQLKGLGSLNATSAIPGVAIRTGANMQLQGVEMISSRGINACSAITLSVTASSFSADTANGGIINNSDGYARSSDAVTVMLTNNSIKTVSGYYGIILGADDTLNATGNTFSGPGTAILVQDDLTGFNLGNVHGSGAGGNTFAGFTGDSMSYAVEVACQFLCHMALCYQV